MERGPHHADDGARGHVGNKSREESLGLKVAVVLAKEFRGGLLELEGHELESLLLKALQNLADLFATSGKSAHRDMKPEDLPHSIQHGTPPPTNEASLDAIRLDHDVGALSGGGGAGHGWLGDDTRQSGSLDDRVHIGVNRITRVKIPQAVGLGVLYNKVRPVAKSH